MPEIEDVPPLFTPFLSDTLELPYLPFYVTENAGSSSRNPPIDPRQKMIKTVDAMFTEEAWNACKEEVSEDEV